MGTISSARAYYGLIASGTPTGINVSGSVPVGVNQDTVPLTTADICYSFKITATTDLDVATLDATTGVITKTTGTPDVTRRLGGTSDLAALDFEGAAIPSLASLGVILIQRNQDGLAGDEITITSSGTSNPTLQFEAIDNAPPLMSPLNPDGTIAFLINDIGDSVTVTVAGKSS